MRFEGPVINGPLEGKNLAHDGPYYRVPLIPRATYKIDPNEPISETVRVVTYVFDRKQKVWRLVA